MEDEVKKEVKVIKTEKVKEFTNKEETVNIERFLRESSFSPVLQAGFKAWYTINKNNDIHTQHIVSVWNDLVSTFWNEPVK
jgi:hypothetical protein